MPSTRLRKVVGVCPIRVDLMKVAPNVLQCEILRRHELVEPQEDLGCTDFESTVFNHPHQLSTMTNQDQLPIYVRNIDLGHMCRMKVGSHLLIRRTRS